MRKNLFFFIGLVFLLLVNLNLIHAVSEKDVLIVSDDNSIYDYTGITSASYYQAIINNVSNGDNFFYNITIWNQSLLGSPTLNYLQSFGVVIWATGDFWGYAPSSGDVNTLENYIKQGGNLIISGTYIMYDWKGTSFANNVLHAISCGGILYDRLYDINMTNVTHPVTTGFGQNEQLTFIASPGGSIYSTDLICGVVNGGQALANRGQLSTYPESFTMIAFENSTNTARVLYITFPIYLLNETNRTLLVRNAMNWMDKYSPTINFIRFTPNDTDNIDPNVQINVTANITDINNVSSVIFEYRCAAAAGLCSPGTDVFINITMDYNNSTKLYENASFTPNVPGIWQYKILTNDSLNNGNYTIYNLSVEYDYSWTRTPSIFNTTSCFFSTTCSLGNLTINNTGDYNLTFDLSSNYGNTFFNITEPFGLTAKNFTTIHINATAEGSMTESNILITINATTPNANPTLLYTNVTLVSYSGGSYLDVKITNYNSTINQSQTMNLTSYIKNIGNETAVGVWLNWTFPSGWVNTSGNLSQYLGNLTLNSIIYINLSASITSSASSGIAIINANATSSQGTNDSDSKSIDVSCYSGDAVCGSGCTYLTDSDCTRETITVSSGGGGGVAKEKPINYSKTIEIVRGEENVFNIEIYNKYFNSSLENLTLKIIGFPSQYIVISPLEIDKINTKQTKNFTVKIKIPSYKEYEEYTLKATITGFLISGKTKTRYTETQNIKLIIQEISAEESSIILSEAESAVDVMIKAGFNVDEISKILEQAKSKSLEHRNKESQILSEKILEIKKKSFDVNNLIKSIREALQNPKTEFSLIGNIVEDFNRSDKKIQINQLITEKPPFTSESVMNMLNLAIVAFERGDYDVAENRAENARNLLVLERKGNFGLFLYLYWPFVLVGFIIFSLTGILGYTQYQKSSITRKIEDINNEEKNISGLIQKSQQQYFTGKISAEEYHQIMNQHQSKLAKLKKTRLILRNKRINILKPEQIFQELDIEKLQIEGEIRKLQENFYRDKKGSEAEYKIQFQILNERLAEIEDERTTLELLKEQKSEKRNNKENGAKDIVKIGKNKHRIIGFFKKISRKIIKNDKKGIILVDNKILDILKQEIGGKNCKKKWIKLNFKNEN